MTNSLKSKTPLSKATEVKIGDEVFICFGGKPEKHIVRSRMTEREMKKFNIKYPKEESEGEYLEYKRMIKLYLKNGNLFKAL
jgi:hypothetical protein